MAKPKVLSNFGRDRFESRFLNVPMIGKPVDCFVECKSYDLEIPVNASVSKELDIFEETILKMVKLNKSSVDDLAKTLCLDKDLVNFILIRLNESGMLEDNQTVSDRGNEVLDAQNKARTEVEYMQGQLFVIRKTGQILPYIHLGEFQSENVDDFDASTITLGFGSAGNYYKLKGKCIRNKDFEKRMGSVLDTRVVKKTILNYNKLATARGLSPIPLCLEYAITSSASENVYIHFQAVVQDGNVDELMFSDGFVSNVDGIMEYVLQESPDLLNEIKARAVDMTISTVDGEKKLYRNQKYREILHYYENACSHLSDTEYEEATVDERKEINEGKRQIIINCYYMLEWGLYYYTLKNRLSEQMVNLFSQRSFSANEKTLRQFANAIGAFYSDSCSNLFAHVDGKKIAEVYNYNSPKLYVCLPLAIAEAKENSSSEIHKVIQHNRSFLKFVNFLNSFSGNLRHDSEADAIDMKAKEILEETAKIIQIMLPDISLVADSKKQDDDISRVRLLGQVSLEKKMGSLFFASLSNSLKNEWIKISPDKNGNRLPDKKEYVEILYRILQTELTEALSEMNSLKNKSKDEAMNYLSEKFAIRVPKSIYKVRESFYDHARNGEKSTLGAVAIVYAVNVDDTTLSKLIDTKYLNIVDKVLTLRQHNTLVAFNETEDTLSALRDEVIDISKIIGGFYD